jgi:hypothetical protein
VSHQAPPQKPLPQKPHWMSEEDWQEQLEEMKAHAKRLYRQSGGRLDVWPCETSQPKYKQ